MSGKYKQGEVVLVKIEGSGEAEFLPTLVKSVVNDGDSIKYCVSFIENDGVEQDEVIFDESAIMSFQEQNRRDHDDSKVKYVINEEAKKMHRQFLGGTDENFKWNLKDLKKFLNALLIDASLKKDEIKKAITEISQFQLKEEHYHVYIKEQFCQILNLLICEKELNESLRKALQKLMNQMTELLLSFMVTHGCVTGPLR